MQRPVATAQGTDLGGLLPELSPLTNLKPFNAQAQQPFVWS